MRSFALLLILLVAFISLLFGIKYLLARKFMLYHETIVGKPWEELDENLRLIILGMLRIIGGGLVTTGASLAWLLVPFSRGEAWASWAVLTIGLLATCPTAYVLATLKRAQPKAKPPIIPTIASFVLICLAVFIG